MGHPPTRSFFCLPGSLFTQHRRQRLGVGVVQGLFPGDLSILDQLLEVLIEGDAAVLAVGLDHRR